MRSAELSSVVYDRIADVEVDQGALRRLATCENICSKANPEREAFCNTKDMKPNFVYSVHSNGMFHILLVEDNPGDVHLVREGLRVSAIPADLVIASDGEQALRFLSEFNVKPGFIILDLNLPKFSGLELLERYRADERPPVVVLSGSENPRDKTRALELGASEYILKPFDYQEFIQLVRGTVERWGGSASHASS
jgi:chemotaxis family two-component system response regulator Rcp1